VARLRPRVTNASIKAIRATKPRASQSAGAAAVGAAGEPVEVVRVIAGDVRTPADFRIWTVSGEMGHQPEA
jgi:hypothetical protein